MIYILENQTNKKKYVGKTMFDKEHLKMLLFDILDDKLHYNKYLQKEWNKNNFKIIFYDCDDCEEMCDKIIKDEELLNPLFGYNVFSDLKSTRGRNQKRYLFNDDLCLTYCFMPKIPFLTRTFDLQRNIVTNRLSNYNLCNTDYYKRLIARYEDFYWTAAQLLYTDKQCLTASQLMYKMFNKYSVSDMLRITPRKISKFYVTNGLIVRKDKKKGCLVFCPRNKEN